MQELRPHLKKEEFLATVRLQESEGYNLAYVPRNNVPIACAGYRILHNLSSGKTLYVDDLVTGAIERSSGYGATLLSWLRQEAQTAGCSFFHLDSGVQRHEAHKFYFKNGMSIVYYHFAESLSAEI